MKLAPTLGLAGECPLANACTFASSQPIKTDELDHRQSANGSGYPPIPRNPPLLLIDHTSSSPSTVDPNLAAYQPGAYRMVSEPSLDVVQPSPLVQAVGAAGADAQPADLNSGAPLFSLYSDRHETCVLGKITRCQAIDRSTALGRGAEAKQIRAKGKSVYVIRAAGKTDQAPRSTARRNRSSPSSYPVAPQLAMQADGIVAASTASTRGRRFRSQQLTCGGVISNAATTQYNPARDSQL